MRLLVVEDAQHAAQPVVERLAEAGHAVTYCNDPDGPGFPCKGLHDPPACPLDREPIDLVVVARDECGATPTIRETGAGCAIRRHVPLVEVGQHQDSPYRDFAAAISQGPEGAVHAVEYTAAHPLPRHTLEASRVFRHVLDKHDLTWVSANCEVHRHERSLVIQLLPDHEIPLKVVEVAAVRVSGAVRALDPDALAISVCHPRDMPSPTLP